MLSGELQIIQGIQSLFQSPFGKMFVVFCARWLVFVFAILAAMTSLAKKRRNLRHAAFEAAWAGLLALLIALVLGSLIGRARPFHTSSDIALLIPPPASTYSFPSGHTSVAFAVAAAFAYGSLELGLVAFVCAWLVAFGRVAAGVHYPSDILGGIAVGLLAFAIVRLMHRAIRARDLRQKNLV